MSGRSKAEMAARLAHAKLHQSLNPTGFYTRLIKQPAFEPPKKRAHRPKGSGYQKSDEKIVAQMEALIRSGEANSPTRAFTILVGRGVKIAGNGSEDSKRNRLVKAYKTRVL